MSDATILELARIIGGTLIGLSIIGVVGYFFHLISKEEK
jgi:preprotein translocase subunit Sss1